MVGPALKGRIFFYFRVAVWEICNKMVFFLEILLVEGHSVTMVTEKVSFERSESFQEM